MVGVLRRKDHRIANQKCDIFWSSLGSAHKLGLPFLFPIRFRSRCFFIFLHCKKRQDAKPIRVCWEG